MLGLYDPVENKEVILLFMCISQHIPPHIVVWPDVLQIGEQGTIPFCFFLKGWTCTTMFHTFQMQFLEFWEEFPFFLKVLYWIKPHQFVPWSLFPKLLWQEDITSQREKVSAGGFSSFSEGLWCLFFNRNWALSKHKFLFQSKRFQVLQHLCFLRMSISCWFPHW